MNPSKNSPDSTTVDTTFDSIPRGTFGKSSITIKIYCDNQIRRISSTIDQLTYDDICFRIQRIFNKSVSGNISNLILFYTDPEEELILMDSDEDVAQALLVTDTLLKITVFDKETLPKPTKAAHEFSEISKSLSIESDSDLSVVKDIFNKILNVVLMVNKKLKKSDDEMEKSSKYLPLSSNDLDELIDSPKPNHSFMKHQESMKNTNNVSSFDSQKSVSFNGPNPPVSSSSLPEQEKFKPFSQGLPPVSMNNQSPPNSQQNPAMPFSGNSVRPTNPSYYQPNTSLPAGPLSSSNANMSQPPTGSLPPSLNRPLNFSASANLSPPVSTQSIPLSHGNSNYGFSTPQYGSYPSQNQSGPQSQPSQPTQSISSQYPPLSSSSSMAHPPLPKQGQYPNSAPIGSYPPAVSQPPSNQGSYQSQLPPNSNGPYASSNQPSQPPMYANQSNYPGPQSTYNSSQRQGPFSSSYPGAPPG